MSRRIPDAALLRMVESDLLKIEAHHVEINQKVGRSEDRSQTLRLVRRCLYALRLAVSSSSPKKAAR